MENKISKFQWELMSKFRGSLDPQDSIVGSLVVSYIVLLAQKNLTSPLLDFNLDNVIEFERDNELKMFLKEESKKIDDSIFNEVLKKDNEVIKSYFLNVDFSNLPMMSSLGDITPRGIISLVGKILDIQEKDVIGDVGSGAGDFSIHTSVNFKNNEYNLYDISFRNSMISKMRSNVLMSDYDSIFNIETKNVLFDKPTSIFDKAFMHMPFALRENDEDTLKRIKSNIPLLSNLRRSSNLDWAFIIYLLNALKDDGVGIALTLQGTTFNLSDKEYRQFLVDKGYLKGIIALPAKLLNNTSVPVVLYVIGKNPTGYVKIVDATEVYESERRFNVLSEDNINEIFEAYKNDSKISKSVSVEEIKSKDYILIPSRYINYLEFEDGIPFSDFGKIQRGAMFTAKVLDEMSTQRVTDYQYLMISDVQDGLITEELNYIDNIEEKDYRYIIKEGNIVLSKIGAPFKSAVMDERETNILANGNLYILEIDETKADPFYIHAFIQSEEGQELLASRAKGSTFASLGVGDLSEIKFPLPSLEEQRKIGLKMKEALSDLKEYTNKLEKTKVKLSRIFKLKD